MSSANEESLSAYLSHLLETGDDSDLLITCAGKEWTVHSLIVLRCPFFASEAKEHFKDGEPKTLNVPAADPKVIDTILEYLYTPDNEVQSLLTETHDFMFLSDVHEVAAKFMLSGLKALAYARLETLLADYATNYSDLINQPSLAGICKVYSSIQSDNRHLQELILKTALEAEQQLFGPNTPQAHVKQTLRQYPEFAADFAVALLDKFSGVESLASPHTPSREMSGFITAVEDKAPAARSFVTVTEEKTPARPWGQGQSKSVSSSRRIKQVDAPLQDISNGSSTSTLLSESGSQVPPKAIFAQPFQPSTPQAPPNPFAFLAPTSRGNFGQSSAQPTSIVDAMQGRGESLLPNRFEPLSAADKLTAENFRTRLLQAGVSVKPSLRG